jgi:hypothetical protein
VAGITVAHGRIAEIDLVTDPAKLRAVTFPPPSSSS